MAASPDTLETQETLTPGDAQGLIAGRYRIEPERPLPHLDTAGAKAFAVSDTRDSDSRLFVLVHEQGIPHRQDAAEILLKSPATNTLNPLYQEVIVPFSGHPERLVTVMEAPGGPSLAEVFARLPINGHRLRKTVVPGLLKALSALHERQICHRAIRPDNIYFASDSLDDVVLGDCIGGPPGADQPAHYEPIERSLADPFGRGAGDPECDMYALGVTMLAAHLGVEPARGRHAEKLYAARIAQGSFWAFSSGVEIPGIVGSLLRGLLNDDSDERWTKAEIYAWLESAAPNRRSVNTLWTFARPVSFRRESYSDRRMLARDLSKHPLEAASFLRGLDIDNWMSNMITTELFSERQERLLAVEPSQDLSSSRHGDHAMVARVCSHFDPRGPIRFRGLSLSIDGIGPAIAEAFAMRDERRQENFADLFADNVLPTILEVIADRNPLVQKVVYGLTEASRNVRMRSLGLGLERALYDLNRSLPCLSEQFRNRWLTDPSELLIALDARAAQASEISSLLDRHVLAFLSSRVDQTQRYVDRMAAARSDRVRLITAVIDLLAFLQSTLRVAKLPNLTNLLVKNIRPILKDMHGKTGREASLGKLDTLAKRGDLQLVAESLNLGRLIQRDAQGYAEARRRIRQLALERDRLTRAVHPSQPSAKGPGYRLAAAAGWLALMITLVVIFVTG